MTSSDGEQQRLLLAAVQLITPLKNLEMTEHLMNGATTRPDDKQSVGRRTTCPLIGHMLQTPPPSGGHVQIHVEMLS